MTMFEATQLAPRIGARVSGLDLSGDLLDETMRALIALLFERGVVVIPGQRLSHADFARFAGYFGRPLEFFIPEHRIADYPVIIRIDNNPATPENQRDGAVHWHSDSSYETEPGAVTMLYGIEAPVTGGETHFANTAAAYADLPEGMRARLDPLVALHGLGRAPWIDGETVPDPNRPHRHAESPSHPLIMAHPVTGRKAIFTSGTAYAVEGIDAEEASALIRQLREHVVQPQYRTSYKVMPGDVVLWDNFGTVHSASPIPYSAESGARRLLHRISTKGVPALCTTG